MTVEESKKLLENMSGDIDEWRKASDKLKKVGVFYTSWYPEVISGLLESCDGFLAGLKIKDKKIDRIKVSGSWELPLAVQSYLKTTKASFVVVLGCVVKGETPHFDILCNTVASNLMRLQLEEEVPLGFGVLTVNSKDQAMQRLNKGAEAAEAAFRSWIGSK